MYIPRLDGAFGSFYFHTYIPNKTRSYGQAFRLERTHIKLLKTDNQECDDENSEPNTTMCITRHLEQALDCSMGLQGGGQNIERYPRNNHQKI